jgi:hypothetical protein
MGSDAGIGAGGAAAGCAGDAARGAGACCALGLASCSKGSMSESPVPVWIASQSTRWMATAHIQQAAGIIECICIAGSGAPAV